MSVVSRWVVGSVVASVFAFGGAAVGLGGVAAAAPPSPQAQGRAPVLHGSLAPSVPTDGNIFGVPPGGVPWSIASGHVLLGSDGTLQVNVARLIDPVLGDNPVPYLAASVYCGGQVVATTATVPFSSEGNAHLRATVAVPAMCSDPTVLLNPAKAAGAPLGAYIASSSLGD